MRRPRPPVDLSQVEKPARSAVASAFSLGALREAATVYGEMVRIPAFARTAESRPLAAFVLMSSMLLALLAFIVAAVFGHHLRIEAQLSPPSRRVQDLVNLLREAEDRQGRLESEVARLRQRIATRNAQAGPGAMPDPQSTLLLRQAGLGGAQGKGITVVLDAPRSPAKNAPQGQSPLQADDLLRLVNDLKAAGATAIAINGQRLVAQSAIVNAGTVLMVNHRQVALPVTVQAIGDAPALRAALQLRGGILEYLEFWGIQARIRDERRLKLPAYAGEPVAGG